jgi:Family of unknown function (DUF5906)
MDGKKETVVLYEPVDVVRLDNLVSYLTKHDPENDTLDRLIEYKSKVKYSKVRVEYDYSKNLQDVCYGRLYAKNGLSLQMLERNIRGFIAAPIGFDVDFENAQPVLLYNFAKKKGWQCMSLGEYVHNRDKILSEVMKAYNICRDKAKAILLALMFLGKLENNDEKYLDALHVEQVRKIRASKVCKFLKKLEDEISGLSLKIVETEKDVMSIAERNTKGLDEWSRRAYCMSLFLHTEECKVLMSLKRFMERKKRKVITLIHDGMIIKKSSADEPEVPRALLDEAEKYVLCKTGYKMKLAQKPMKSKYEDLVLSVTNTPTKGDMDKIASHIDAIELLKSNKNMSYADKKYLFERFHAKVRDPLCYITFKDQQSFSFRTRDAISEAYSSISFIDPGTGAKTNFITEWLKDEENREYESVDFLPPPLTCPKGVLNMWQGFAVDAIPDAMANKGSADMFLRHIDILVNHDKAGRDYVTKWLAHMFQRPGELTGIALVFISSKEGAGKNRFIDLLKNMMGAHYTYETANIKRDLFGQFSNGRFNKLLVNIDESNRKKTSEFHDEMKHMITSTVLNYEKKNVDQIVVRNFNRFIITSNNEVPIIANDSDRRYAIFKCSNERAGDQGYFEEFTRYMSDLCNLKAIHRYLLAVDISTIKWIRDRPVTQQARLVMAEGVGYFDKFLEHQAIRFIREGSASVRTTGGKFMAELQDYCQTQLNMKDWAWGRKCAEVGSKVAETPGIVKTICGGKTYYTINVKVLKEHLKAKHLLNEHAFMFHEDQNDCVSITL